MQTQWKHKKNVVGPVGTKKKKINDKRNLIGKYTFIGRGGGMVTTVGYGEFTITAR